MAPDADPAPFLSQITWLTVLFRANLRTPLIESALVAVDDVRHHHTRDRENQYADKNLVGLEGRARDCDHEADAGCGGI